MKKKDLVPGVRYVVVTKSAEEGRRTRRAGIPDVDTYTYFGDSHPGLTVRKDQVIVYKRWSGGKEVRLTLVRPADIWSTEAAYDTLCEQYDEKSQRRELANRQAAEYLVEQLQLLYKYDEVWFDAENGHFQVSPKVMAELHNMPVPGRVEVPDLTPAPAPSAEVRNVA